MTSNKKMKTLSKTNMCYEKIRLWCVKMTPPRKSSVPLSFKKEYHVSPLLGKFSLACSLKKNPYACSPCQKVLMRVLLAKKFPTHLPHDGSLLLIWLWEIPHFFPYFSNLPKKTNPPNFKLSFQNLPRRVPHSLNANGKFLCKNMKFFEIK